MSRCLGALPIRLDTNQSTNLHRLASLEIEAREILLFMQLYKNAFLGAD